jgi:hypothetical protein
MSDLRTHQDATNDADDRTNPIADKFARFLELNIKRLAYGIAVLAWLTLGFAAWLAVLFAGMAILLASILFKLIARLPIKQDIRQFLLVLQFWPDGFSSLSSAFREKIELDGSEAREEAIFVFTTLRLIYVAAVIYLVACLFQSANPFTYVFYLPGNAVMVFILFAILTLGMSWLADKRRINGSIYSPRPSSPDTQLPTEVARDTDVPA